MYLYRVLVQSVRYVCTIGAPQACGRRRVVCLVRRAEREV